MKMLNTAALGLSAVLASGTAFAAVNPDAVHLALDSLLVATAKVSVFNAMRTNGKPPAANADAHLGAPSSMTTNEISGIVVNNGIINVYLAPTTGTDRGLVQYVPKLMDGKQKGKKAVEFACISPNIPEIATIAPACKYQPTNQPAAQPPKK